MTRALLFVVGLLLFGMQTPVQAQGSNCGMQLGGAWAFCDTFDAPAGIGNRSGQLNGTIWGVSRWTGDMNFGTNYSVPWVKGTLDGCNGPQPAQPDGTDIIICNGQMREVTNDNATGVFEAGTVTALAMYPKQPFDFAGRTGTVSFDVSNDTQGTHAAWPEFWLTDKPIPTPFTHFADSGGTIPQHGLGIRFAGSLAAGQAGDNCPAANNVRWTVDSAIVIRNYVIDDTAGYGVRTNMSVTNTGCVVAPNGPNGGLNHVELQISQNLIEVYATDAGTITPLKKIAVINNPNLSLTRGLIWIEDVHYNADKSFQTPLQHNHTFVWDNVAFDGPFTYRDKSYDVNDSLTPCHDGTLCLGWQVIPGQAPVLQTMPMDAADIAAAATQRLMFNAYFFNQPTSFSVTINGHPYSFAWPFPFTGGFSQSSFSFDINKADLVAGPQAVTIQANEGIQLSNVNIVLVNLGGTPPPPTPINGACGSANGVAVASAPTTNLCSAGTASAVTGTGPWNWSCTGSNGGTTASCSAPLANTRVNGQCGPVAGTTLTNPFTMPPASSLCSAGTVFNPRMQWTCRGSGGGGNSSCSAFFPPP